MKTLGLIGGTSWVSTADYYKYINEMTNERLGRVNSAKLFLYSVNYEEFKTLADAGKWDECGNILSGIARKLEQAGAECILLCANTMHMTADTVQRSITIPLLHIADAAAKAISKQKISTAALLGTKFTMENDFFTKRLSKYNITAIIPDDDEREFIHTTIFSELGKGIFKEETKKKYLDIIERLQQKGAEGAILACTEIPMLIKPDDCTIPTFDTAFIHATDAVNFALS